jgi:hypothetical protein
MTDDDDEIAEALNRNLTSFDNEGGNLEAVNMVDGLFAIAHAIQGLTEMFRDVAPGLYAIEQALSKVAENIPVVD